MKRIIGMLLVMTMILSVMSIAADNTGDDLNGHWSEGVFRSYMEQTLIEGYGDGTFRPDGEISRAEFVTVINRIVRPVVIDDVILTDVQTDDWFREEVLKALTAGYMDVVGEGVFGPDQKITREEVAVAIAKLMAYEEGNPTVLMPFEDHMMISDEAVGAYAALVENDLLKGSDNHLMPRATMTRAEMLTLLNRLFGKICRTPGEYTGEVDGNMTISYEGVVLKDLTVNGDLYLAEGIGFGDLKASEVRVVGNLISKGATLSSMTEAFEVTGTVTVLGEEGSVSLYDSILALAKPKDKKSNSRYDRDDDKNQEQAPDGDDAIRMLASFEEGIPNFVTEADTSLALVTEGATHGSSALKVTYPKADFPSVKFRPEEPYDIGDGNCLAWDVTNTSDHQVTFYVRMDDAADADGQKNSRINMATIQPGTTESVFISFSDEVLDIGMRGLPPSSAGRSLAYGWGETSLDLSQIHEFQFWLMFNKQEASLIFDNIRIMPDPNVDSSHMDGIIDAYGQYNGLDWDGKIGKDQELRKAADLEAAALALEGPLLDGGTYGGWTEGPNLGATGRFRVDKYNGKYTLVDPDGYLFFATGLDIIRFGDASTWITGRENMFVEVPDKEGAYGDHYTHVGQVARPPLGLDEGWSYNYYTANLQRKYGEDYIEEWQEMSLNRFKNWGFTTLGNWVDPELFFGKGDKIEMPYVANGWIHGDHAKLDSGNEFWGALSDPFDPSFRVDTRKMIEEVNAYGVGEDAWCMGIYVDNEIAWGNPASDEGKYAVITAAFNKNASDSDAFAKRAFTEKLKELHNHNIMDLNSAWGTAIEGWDDLERAYDMPELNAGIKEDLSVLLSYMADEYFRIVDEELTAVMPEVLNLGARFAEWGTSIEVQKAAAKYVDVVSFNVYKEDVDQDWIYAEEMDMPLIVGEFHFGAVDRGQFAGGIVTASSQQARGDMYKTYMRSVANSDYFIGAHWFQYVDQPVLGRAWDGENYNTGFVDITDRPYDLLVEAAKNIHSQIYGIRYDKVEVTGITLDRDAVTIDVTTEASVELIAQIVPDQAEFKDILWSVSDPAIASVDDSGNVTGLSNGQTVVTATSVDAPSVKVDCRVTVIGFEAVETTFPTISFEEGDNLGIMSGELAQSYVTDGVTSGARALQITEETKGAWKNIGFYPSESWVIGDGDVVYMDVTNPSDALATQIRINMGPDFSQVSTYFFTIPPGVTTTVGIGKDQVKVDAASGVVGGNWGASLDEQNIAFMTIYFGEDAVDSLTVIIDNIRVE